MESIENNELRSRIPMIFRPITHYEIQNILEKNEAKTKETKAVFLIRDNSAHPGIITISYYSQELDMVKSTRIGLTENGWKMAPKPPKEPKLMDSIEVKETYKHEKEEFDKEWRHFVETAKSLFEHHTPSEHIKTLVLELQKNEFHLGGLIKPNKIQASQIQQFKDYVSDAFVSEEQSNQIHQRYVDW